MVENARGRLPALINTNTEGGGEDRRRLERSETKKKRTCEGRKALACL